MIISKTANPTSAPRRRTPWAAAAILSAGILIAGCSAVDLPERTSSSDASFFDTDEVHSISIEYDDADYEAMIDAYAETDSKEWISATVAIDGQTFEEVGLRLKGNSSLRGLGNDQRGPSAQAEDDDAAAQTNAPQGEGFSEGEGTVSAEDPAGLPWLIRLDKYVDGQEYAGRSDFVVRGNNTETSLNEAVALYAINQANVAGEEAAYTRLSVNGSDEQLRLVIDLPDDDAWNDDAFGGTGITYKADSEGDYSYRGEDSEWYLDAFDVKFEADGLSQDAAYAPLIAFLNFINNSTDEEFEEHLSDYLEVDSFADYLAVQDLVSNADDIDGPGNNSYLHYDPETGLMTVVAWDQNLSFGGLGGMGVGGPQGGGPGERMMPADGEERPDPSTLPTEAPTDVPDGAHTGEESAPRGMQMGGTNVLSSRFLANDTFHSAYDTALDTLITSVYDSGDAQAYLDDLVALLTDQASDLVDANTIQTEADSIASMLTGDSVSRQGTDVSQ